MRKQLTDFIERLQLGEAEIGFLSSFSEGTIQAELLFDIEEAKRINQLQASKLPMH